MELKEESLSLLQKYFRESVLFALSTAVIYLFILYKDLNDYVKDEFIKQVVETRITIQENTKVLIETQSLIKKQTKNEQPN